MKNTSYVHTRPKGKKIVTNQISACAVRFVANCIIAQCAIILNTVYEKMIREGVAQKIIDKFARISPIALGAYHLYRKV